jgi:hypothetical protein
MAAAAIADVHGDTGSKYLAVCGSHPKLFTVKKKIWYMRSKISNLVSQAFLSPRNFIIYGSSASRYEIGILGLLICDYQRSSIPQRCAEQAHPVAHAIY